MFEDLVTRLDSNQFLPAEYVDSSQFASSDNEETFKKSLETQSKNWRYREKEVTYTVNTDGYRTLEFDRINWGESVVIFGCSIVFGVGLDDSETISSCLSRIINRPVINMGVSSSSPTFATHNAIILKQCYPTPKAVVNIWSSIDRTTYYHNDHVQHAVVDSNKHSYFHQWNRVKSNPIVNSLFLQRMNKIMWKDIPYFEASFFEHSANCFKCEHVHAVDCGRDLMHPGHRSAEILAKTIAENLKL
jgi:hypothetical protein